MSVGIEVFLLKENFLHNIFIENAVYLHLLCLPLYCLKSYFDTRYAIFHSIIYSLIKENLRFKILRQSFKSRGKVDGIPDNSVIHPLLRTDIAGNNLSVTNTDACLYLRFTHTTSV